MAPTSDGGYLITGATFSFATGGGSDAWLVKVNRFGNIEWSQVYGGTNFEFARQVIQTSDGGLLIGGATRSFGAGDYDVILYKTNADATVVDWQETYGGSEGEWGAYLLELPDGYAFSGSAKSFGNIQDDLYLVRTDFMPPPFGSALMEGKEKTFLTHFR